MKDKKSNQDSIKIKKRYRSTRSFFTRFAIYLSLAIAFISFFAVLLLSYPKLKPIQLDLDNEQTKKILGDSGFVAESSLLSWSGIGSPITVKFSNLEYTNLYLQEGSIISAELPNIVIELKLIDLLIGKISIENIVIDNLELDIEYFNSKFNNKEVPILDRINLLISELLKSNEKGNFKFSNIIFNQAKININYEDEINDINKNIILNSNRIIFTSLIDGGWKYQGEMNSSIDSTNINFNLMAEKLSAESNTNIELSSISVKLASFKTFAPLLGIFDNLYAIKLEFELSKDYELISMYYNLFNQYQSIKGEVKRIYNVENDLSNKYYNLKLSAQEIEFKLINKFLSFTREEELEIIKFEDGLLNIDFETNFNESYEIINLAGNIVANKPIFTTTYLEPSNKYFFDQISTDILWEGDNDLIKLSNLNIIDGNSIIKANINLAHTLEEMSAIINISNMPINRILDFFPVSISPLTYDWLRENITQADISNFNIGLGFSENQPFYFDGDFNFNNTTLHYLRPMTPLTNLSGNAELTKNGINIIIDESRIGDLTVTSGSEVYIEFRLPEKNYGYLTAKTNISGSARELFNITNSEPLNFLTSNDIILENVSGDGSYDINLFTTLRNKDRDSTDIDFDFDLHFNTINIDKGFFDLAFKDVTADVVYKDNNIFINGEGFLSDSYTVFEWNQFGTKAGTIKRKINLTSEFVPLSKDLSLSYIIGLGFPGKIEGKADLTINWDDNIDETSQMQVEADLVNVDLYSKFFNIVKPANSKANFISNIKISKNKEILSSNETFIRFSNSEIYLSGEIGLKDFKLRNLILRSNKIGTTKYILASYKDSEDNFELMIDADLLDISEIIYVLRNYKLSKSNLKNVSIKLNVNRLITDKLDLPNINVDLWNNEAGVLKGIISSNDNDINLIEAKINDSIDEFVSIKVPNLSSLIAGSEYENIVSGGDLLLKAIKEDDKININFELNNLSLLEAPAILRLTEFLSLFGTAATINNSGIVFNEIKVEGELKEFIFKINSGSAISDSIGFAFNGDVDFENYYLDLEGSYAPFYQINRSLGAIPIINFLIADPSSNTIFASNFKLSGNFDSPIININPFSTFVPGFLKRMVTISSEQNEIKLEQEIINEDDDVLQ